ncbi:MAG: cytochrome c oxidase subunit II [Bacteroidetes bacterium]|nr:cytochrome c oxidase subunit II [Bacteroidota bacterium]
METLLIIAVLVLGFMVVLRLSRVAALASELRGDREEQIPERDNRISGRMMWAFGALYMAFFIWIPLHYHDVFLPPAASTQGVWIDSMFTFNWWMLGIVFFGTNIALFYFSGKYYHRADRRAFWYPHNNRLELVWTTIPALTLTGVVVYALIVWTKITVLPAPGTMEVEIYAKQFDWTFRYPGKDGKLGATDFRLIDADNPLGIATKATMAKRLDELHAQVAQETADRDARASILPTDELEKADKHIAHLRRQIEGIMNLQVLMQEDVAANGNNSTYLKGADDKVTKEFHLPVNTDVELIIRSQDVIHSAYLPHMRAQMNAVPGMATRMHLVPTITTDSMRTITKNPAFDYILLCNKVCGISHYNMQSPLTVESAGAFKVWNIMLPVFEKPGAAAKEAIPAPADTAKAVATAAVATAAPATNKESN